MSAVIMGNISNAKHLLSENKYAKVGGKRSVYILFADLSELKVSARYLQRLFCPFLISYFQVSIILPALNIEMFLICAL